MTYTLRVLATCLLLFQKHGMNPYIQHKDSNFMSMCWCRNPIKDHLVSYLGDPSRYYGPDECIDDHVETKYLDNDTVD